MKLLSRNNTVALLLIASSCASMACAQSTDAAVEDNGDHLADIIVTAQKRAEPLQRVPVAVSAFSAKTLETIQSSSLTSLRGIVPGLTITRAGAAANTPQFSLRGISLQDTEKSVDSGIGVTLDGVPLGVSTGSLLDSFDVERIEVLRGPQGLLFGKNTTGGTINVIRSRPNPDAPTSGKFRVQIGSFGANSYQGVIMTPIVPGILAGKIAINVDKDHGEFKNIAYGGRNGDRDIKDFLVGLNATPSSDLELNLILEHLEDDSEIPPFTPIPVPNVIALPVPGYFGGANVFCVNPFLAASCLPFSKSRNTVEIKPPTPAYFNLNAATFEATYNLNALKIVGITGYRESKEASISDPDGSRFAIFRNSRPQTYWQFSQELRAESNFSGPFQFVAGAFYFRNRYGIDSRLTLDRAGLVPAAGAPFIAPGTSFLNSTSSFTVHQDAKSYALFFQGEYKIVPAVTVILGGRQTWDKKIFDYTNYVAFVSPVRDNAATGAISSQTEKSAKFQKFTPKVGVELQATHDMLVYANFSRGYNTGGFNGRAATAALVGPYQPETLDAYEVGLKSEFFNNRVRFNLAAFHNTMKNKQETLIVFIGASQGSTTINAAKARYVGVEAELAVVPVRGWTISSSASFLDAKYIEFSGNLGQGFVADLTNLKLRRAPRWTAGVISDYRVAAGPGEIGLGGVLTFVDKYQTNPIGDPRGLIPATTKLDLSVRYEFPATSGLKLEVAGFIKNVTNNTTYASATSGNSRGTFIDYAIPSVGRAWGASLTGRF